MYLDICIYIWYHINFFPHIYTYKWMNLNKYIYIYIYIYISSILIYIHTFTSYKNILHPLPPLPHHQGVQYIYIYSSDTNPLWAPCCEQWSWETIIGGKVPKKLWRFFLFSPWSFPQRHPSCSCPYAPPRFCLSSLCRSLPDRWMLRLLLKPLHGIPGNPLKPFRGPNQNIFKNNSKIHSQGGCIQTATHSQTHIDDMGKQNTLRCGHHSRP